MIPRKRSFRRQFSRRGVARGDALPRDLLLKIVDTGGFERPRPKGWEKRK